MASESPRRNGGMLMCLFTEERTRRDQIRVGNPVHMQTTNHHASISEFCLMEAKNPRNPLSDVDGSLTLVPLDSGLNFHVQCNKLKCPIDHFICSAI